MKKKNKVTPVKRKKPVLTIEEKEIILAVLSKQAADDVRYAQETCLQDNDEKLILCRAAKLRSISRKLSILLK